MGPKRDPQPAATQSVKFVGQDAAGLPVKRRQVLHACESCKRRKKRCEHTAESQPDMEASDAAARLIQFQSSHVSDTDSPTITTNSTAVPSPDTRHAKLDRAAPFLGDLNPEGIFVEATMTEVSNIVPVEAEGDSRLGIWGTTDTETLDKSQKDNLLSGTQVPVHDVWRTPHLVLPGDNDSRTIIPVTDPIEFARRAAEAMVQELASVVCPSEQDWVALRGIYIKKIHPIFPIFEKSCLIDMSHTHSRFTELIKASVCLAAASDQSATEHLHLNKPVSRSFNRISQLVPYSDYSKTVVNFIKEGVRLLQAKELVQLVNKIKIMALTCIFWQPEPATRTEPLDFYAGLASMVHTYGIHLKELVDVNKPNSEGIGRGDVGRLFRCLYALDRLTSALSGRPLMFHNYDLLMIPQSDENDSPSFKLFMSIIMLLDKAIDLYRPHAKEQHIDVPVLEKMILDAGAQCEPDGILATLEILYHTVCVTSVRMPRDRFKTSPQMDAVSGVTYSHLPPSILNARRSHSSDRIFDIVKECDRYQLSPMPFIPYGLALSLTVAYRKWRFSRTPMFRARGKQNFEEILPLLADMGKVWTSARINSNLGDVVMAHVSEAERKIRSNSTAASRSRNCQAISPRQAQAQRRALKNDHRRRASQRTEVPPREGSGLLLGESSTGEPDAPRHAPTLTSPGIQSQPHSAGIFSPDQTTEGSMPVLESPVATTSSISGTLEGFDTPTGIFTGANLSSDALAEMDDTFPFRNWDMMDTIDTCFGSNLDPACPIAWPEYSNNAGYPTAFESFGGGY